MEDEAGAQVRRGGEARSRRCVIGVSGMTCASCVGTIERRLRGQPGERRRQRSRVGSGAARVSTELWPAGVAAAFVSLMAGKAEVTYDPDVIGAGAVAGLIQDLGFRATLVEAATASEGTLDLRVSLSLPLLENVPETCHSFQDSPAPPASTKSSPNWGRPVAWWRPPSAWPAAALGSDTNPRPWEPETFWTSFRCCKSAAGPRVLRLEPHTVLFRVPGPWIPG